MRLKKKKEGAWHWGTVTYERGRQNVRGGKNKNTLKKEGASL